MGHTYTSPVRLIASESSTLNVSPPGNVPLGAPTIILYREGWGRWGWGEGVGE